MQLLIYATETGNVRSNTPDDNENDDDEEEDDSNV
jgi:hypothetical protein